MDEDAFVTDEMAEAMGISREAMREVMRLVGRRPYAEELNTLLAMWDSNGRQQSLYGWLHGQQADPAKQHDDYLYADSDEVHRTVREPRVQQCREAALAVCRCLDSPSLPPYASHNDTPPPYPLGNDGAKSPLSLLPGRLIYMVGPVDSTFLDSDYARHYLHIAAEPAHLGDDREAADYHEMILAALTDGSLIDGFAHIGKGGLFAGLCRLAQSSLYGFDILTCREVRLDAFLFGERSGRYLATLEERNDDTFLQKISDAGIDCCFLGRSTKGRVLVDGYDFGNIKEFVNQKQ